MLASSPQLYHGHEELKRTVEDFPEVIADLEALLKTTVLSSTVKAGCCWRLFCTLPSLLPFPHFSTCPTFAARINIPWAPEAESSWSGGEDWNSWRENTHFISAAEWPLLSTVVFLWTGHGEVFIPHELGYHLVAIFTPGFENGNVTMDIREPCLFLLVPPIFERGIRFLVAFSVHCCIHKDTHVCMYVCYQELVRP